MEKVVAIDARMLGFSGIGTYLKNLLENYARMDHARDWGSNPHSSIRTVVDARDWGSNPHSSIRTVCPNLPKNSSLLGAFC